MGMPAGFNPMMAMMNPQFQFQQMLMQQFQRQQQQQQRPGTGSTIPPESQKPPVGYVCFKCGKPGTHSFASSCCIYFTHMLVLGHWIYYCPNVPKGQHVPRAPMGGR